MKVRHLLFSIFSVALLYGHTLGFHYFIFDDPRHIFLNSWMQPPWGSNFLEIWRYSGMPVPFSIWQALSFVFGLGSPAPFRLFNLLIHAANGLLLYLLLLRLFPLLWPEKLFKPFYALGAVCIFLIHPVQVESVVWISSLKDLLSGFFFLLSFILFLELRTQPLSTRRMIIKWILFFGFWGLGLLSKLNAIALIPICLFLDLTLFRKAFKKHWPGYLPLLPAAWLAYERYKGVNPDSFLGFVPEWPHRIWIATDALWFNLRQLLLPLHYQFNYGHTPESVIISYFAHPAVSIAMLTITALTLAYLLAVFLLGRQRALHYSAVWLLIALLPTLGLFPFVHQNLSTTADRYLYLATFAFCIPVIQFLFLLENFSKKLRLALFILLPLGLCSFTILQSRLWQTSTTCLRHSVTFTPENEQAREAYAFALKFEGQEVNAFRELYILEDIKEDARRRRLGERKP